MRRNKRLLAAAVLLFLCVAYALAVLLQITEEPAVSYYSFGLVVLCCLFCALFAEKSPAYGLTQLALFTTVCADYFLVYSDNVHPLPAMLFFSVTQLCYFGRLYLTDSCPKRRRVQLFLRVGLSAFALLLTVLILGESTDALALVSMFYYANLILNVIFAFVGRQDTLLAIGLLLFLLCDTCVGLGNLYAYLPVNEAALNRVLYGYCNLAWVFYSPSQVLLALSLLPRRLRQLNDADTAP